jgi:pyridoxal phosphate enzyme (YggS family)
MSIAENLRRVRERVAAAAESTGRSPDEVRLVGVTKYVGAAEAAELAAAGCPDLGESRPQELWNKADALAQLQERAGPSSAPSSLPETPPIHWHLIGHLQRNKIRRTLPLVTLIHSVDSERLLAAINTTLREGEAPAEPPTVSSRSAQPGPHPLVNILLEVNTSGESAKHGLSPDAVEPLLAGAVRYPHVAIRGLMTMAALEGGKAVAARNFASLRELRERLKRVSPLNVQLDELSMGMSGDFETAVREGATIVRIGSLLWEE